MYLDRCLTIYMCVCVCVCASKTQNTETLPNSANISEPLKKIILTTLLHGASFHQDHLITAQAKDATSASKKNYLSSTETFWQENEWYIFNIYFNVATFLKMGVYIYFIIIIIIIIIIIVLSYLWSRIFWDLSLIFF